MKRGFTLLELLVCIAIVAVLVTFGWEAFGRVKNIGKRELRAEAVKMGAARWTVTNETGDAEFRWNSPKAPTYMDTNGVLAYMRATNEFGILEMRWMPPRKAVEPATNAIDLSVPHDGYILKLKDAMTGKDVDVLIPVYTNVTLLNCGSTTIPLGAGR